MRCTLFNRLVSFVSLSFKDRTSELSILHYSSSSSKASVLRNAPARQKTESRSSIFTKRENLVIKQLISRLRQISSGSQVVSRQQFLEVCAVLLGKKRANDFAHRCLSSGIILRSGEKIYIESNRIIQEFETRLPSEWTAKSKLEFAEKQRKLELLTKRKQQLDEVAQRSTQRVLFVGLSLLVFQWSLYCRLTFYELSWDVMEPVTYFTMKTVAIMFFIYYLRTETVPTYQNIVRRMRTKQETRLYRLDSFDVEHYHKLMDEIELYKRHKSLKEC